VVVPVQRLPLVQLIPLIGHLAEHVARVDPADRGLIPRDLRVVVLRRRGTNMRHRSSTVLQVGGLPEHASGAGVGVGSVSVMC
jgi:hypothetical protein